MKVTGFNDYSDAQGNKVVGHPAHRNVTINFGSHDCRVVVDDSARLENVVISMFAPNGLIEIGADSAIKGYFRTGLDSNIRIGQRLSMTAGGNFSSSECTSVTIGNDCLFAPNVDIRSDHAHPIFDRSTGERTNVSSSVEIGHQVWLAPQVVVLPGARVGRGCVVGYRAVVNSNIPEHCIAAGIPARVVRDNIVWDKAHVSVHKPWMYGDISSLASKLP